MNFVIILSLVIGLAFGNDDDYEYDFDNYYDNAISVSVENINDKMAGTAIIKETCPPPRRCVPHYQCFANGTLKMNGENIISYKYRSADIKRELRRNVVLDGALEKFEYAAEGTECNSLERCCGNDSPPPITTHEFPNLFDVGDVDVFKYKGCGFKNHNSRGVPWVVTLLKKNATVSKSAFLCGGSLIHSRVILTAAHCVNRIKKTEYKVRSGGIPSQERNIIEINQHPYFNSAKLDHDIALVIVDEAFDFNVNVQPICLGEISLRSNSETACTAITWGKDEIKRIKSVQVDVVPATMCQRQLRPTKLGSGFELHRSFMCATAFEERLTCDDDGGLSLVCPFENEPDRYYQTGVVSWSIVGEGKYPDVYTDIAVHRIWINRLMKDNGFSFT